MTPSPADYSASIDLGDGAPISARLLYGDCLARLAELPDSSIDAIITDPPYPMIDRPYGKLTEAQWWELMMAVCAQARRLLTPTGSAVFILQPNSRAVGSMRGWLFEFQAWACREWNMVQDAYWWNTSALPVSGAGDKGMMRPSVKPCVWLGPPDCHRDQDSALWDESDYATAARMAGRFGRSPRPSGWRGDVKPRDTNNTTMRMAAARRGGVTPFNLLPIGNHQSGHGHGAATPLGLADWWTRYICPPGGTVCDPFAGSGTMGLAALARARSFVGVEADAGHFATARDRLAAEVGNFAMFTPRPA